jgi:poly-beta-1,6-N-acetyl-D-glucosamine synthase
MSVRMSENLEYVVITPARNEAQFIEVTLKFVTTQTVLPLKWVIVSDGSVIILMTYRKST